MAERRETLKIIGAISATCTFPYTGNELYGQLEKVVDRFEDVANEISGIVIENV